MHRHFGLTREMVSLLKDLDNPNDIVFYLLTW